MADLFGKWIRLISQVGEHVIPLRQAEIEGVSNQRESLSYKVYTFKVENSDQVLPVFVQHNLSADNYRMVTEEFQYGDWCGKPFLVLHDKRCYKPPQQSFLCAEVSDLILPDENDPGVHGFGFGFGVGTFGFMDPLKDFEAPANRAV